jgi:glucoamylase
VLAPGHPGIPPTWTTSAKDVVGCALGEPRLWFTTGCGILNEVYYPRVDLPQIRDLGFIVADGAGFWVEVKRLQSYQVVLPGPGIPAVEIVHRHPRFELYLRIAPDPSRDVLLVEVRLEGDPALRPYALLAPHLGGTGVDNLAECARHHGRTVLWAEQGPFSLALAAADLAQRDAWQRGSAGYVGISDGWQDFAQNGALTWTFDTAGPGNVALIGELPRAATLALGFAYSRLAAATLAFSALASPFQASWDQHVAAWRAWQAQVRLPQDLPPPLRDAVATSAMVLRVHQDKTYRGAMVASLSVPWGNERDDHGGYHLVWPRDLVESAGGLLALGQVAEARDVLRYLIATQYEDGHWSQNQWLGGTPFWNGLQLDEAAFPVLLAAALAERGALGGVRPREMVHRALGFIARNGPSTDQDRWEEDAGINAFTLAVCIAALVCGADFLEEPERSAALELADWWNDRVEAWSVVEETRLARSAGVDAYYLRIAPVLADADGDGLRHVLPIKNRATDAGLPAEEQVGTDFLQLVRLGLRDPNDALIRASIAVVDRELRVATPSGPCWRRYSGDGYGEHADGSPFDGTGQGRPWPLLTGERGHYELAAGRDALPYLQAMLAMAGPGGLIPEQIWDADALPARRLFPGRPSGSAMPLVWAHAEFVKLAASLSLGRPFDQPRAVRTRYVSQKRVPRVAFWTQRATIRGLRAGQVLRVCLERPAVVHWGVDGWQQVSDTATRPTGLGLHAADLDCQALLGDQRIDMTWHWQDSGQWLGRDYQLRVT